jgi:LAO/AO transport system kinase
LVVIATSLDTVEAQILAGSHIHAARAISLIEDGDPGAEVIVRQLYSHTGNAYSIGFTGPPGAGKSSLVDDMVQLIRDQQKSVGVIAVDPNSPFSGGAILGDRIRMMRHTVDPNVFIRSMGSRGHLGGLAEATSRAVYVLDALGMDFVVLETVGVGQSELEVAGLADTTVVVLMPGSGDSVQTIKAGIMEIADVFVINKADHPSLSKTAADLRELLRLDPRPRAWVPPIVKTVATKEEGTDDLWAAIKKHRRYLEESGEIQAKRRQRLERQILDIAVQRLRERVLIPSAESSEFRAHLDAAARRELDPFSAAQLLVDSASAG